MNIKDTIKQKAAEIFGELVEMRRHLHVHPELSYQEKETAAFVAKKLAYVMCGGDLSEPQLVTEQYLLDLEREAFLSLCGEKKTLERIQSVLKSGKPLRN